ncbi:MAG: transporter substrate-binding domain-containing protein [Pseudomonadota bacterium]
MRLGSIVAVSCLLGAAQASAAQPITVAWRDKPPYYYIEDGVEKGFLLARGKDVFAAAGIEARFVQEPQNRIWANFKHGTPNYCSLAWYRVPERETIAQYSIPLHTDPPQSVLIAPNAVAQVRSHATLASLLADRNLTIGMIDGVSYGTELDARIARSASGLMRRTVSTRTMMRMIAAGRASYVIADRNDWEHMRTHDKDLAPLVQQDFPDMPPGLKRYILCSRDVPASIMDRLNQAIKATAGTASAAGK